jgi:hypothetical protein
MVGATAAYTPKRNGSIWSRLSLLIMTSAYRS